MLTAMTAFCQFDNAVILGTVRDAKTGSVSGASITALNKQTQALADANAASFERDSLPEAINVVGMDLAQAQELEGAARTILDPDRIGWLWIAGRDGRAMLVRRYQGKFGSVDFGRSFWRWMGPRSGAIARGMLVWTREAGVVNAAA